jgi:hypothetical protein
VLNANASKEVWPSLRFFESASLDASEVLLVVVVVVAFGAVASAMISVLTAAALGAAGLGATFLGVGALTYKHG